MSKYSKILDEEGNSLYDQARALGIPDYIFRMRVKKGWSKERLLLPVGATKEEKLKNLIRRLEDVDK